MNTSVESLRTAEVAETTLQHWVTVIYHVTEPVVKLAGTEYIHKDVTGAPTCFPGVSSSDVYPFISNSNTVVQVGS